MDRHTRWFRRLSRLFPADFRTVYGREMEQAFRARRDEVARESAGLLRLWFETVWDLLRTAPGQHLDQMRLDVRYAVRTLSRRPGFSIATALVFAIGTSATTAVFAIVDAALLRPIPFEEPDRLVAVREKTPQDAQPWEVSYPSYLEIRRDSRSFEQVAAYMRNGVRLGGREPQLMDAALVSANLLETLRVQPIAGRGFAPAEDAPGGAKVVMLAAGLARTRFGSAQQSLNEVVRIDDQPYTVIGVLPDGLRFPDEEVQIWMPIGHLADKPWMRNRAVHVALIVGRLKDDVSLEEARAELTAWQDALQAREPGADPHHSLVVRSMVAQVSASARPALMTIASAVVLLLVVTCCSVGLLLLTRGAARGAEVAIRLSLGASRARLVRQLVTETLCLAAIGGAMGVAGSYALLAFLVRGLAGALPPHVVPSIGSAALLVAIIATVVSALVCAIVPAGQALSGVRIPASSHRRVRQRLVAAQIAVSCVLLVVATLLGRSLDRVLRVDLGFESERLLVMRVTAPLGPYSAPGAMTRFYESVTDRLRALPGVTAVTAVNKPALQPGSIGDVTVEGRVQQDAAIVTYHRIQPGYFTALGIPLLDGRDLTDRDGTGEPVVIISAAFERRFWPPGQALGKRIKIGPPEREPWLKIVGVVGDVRTETVEDAVGLAAYEPHAQRPWNGMFMMVRTTGDPLSMTATIRRAVLDVEPETILSEVSTMEERIGKVVAARRFYTMLVGAFAVSTLLLAAIAVYGVLAYAVRSNAREIGIRAAMGATPAALGRAVLIDGLRAGAIGLALGLIIAAVSASAMRALLFEVTPADPWSYIATAALLLCVAAASSWLPARRAARVDPATVLRLE
jgi:putative ABC transport system permease protein